MQTRALASWLLWAGLTFTPLLAIAGDDSLDNYTAERAARTGAPQGSLARVMDSFLNAFAADNPAWRLAPNLKEASESAVPPDGWQKARSPLGLWYFFKPKTADMLSPEERRALTRDRRFLEYVAQMRAASDNLLQPPDEGLVAAGKAKTAPVQGTVIGRAELMEKLLAGRRPPEPPIIFEVSPEELMLPGRVVVTSEEIPQ